MPGPRDQGKIWGNLNLVEEDQKILKQTDIYKCMGPDGMRPAVLRKLADVISRSL